jgi:cation diffusion facilitator CzcD-associated flavoprotein CzcO
MLDVLVIGGGLCAQTVAFALARDGVRNVRVVDRAEYGHEGPWGTYARMDSLRSPKHLTGPDLGFPALTFRAWYEAQHGAQGWQRLHKIATKDWLAYLQWVRDAAGVAIENGPEVTRLGPAADGVRVALQGPLGAETIYARKVVLAGGRDGSGAPHWPSFPSLSRKSTMTRERVLHSSDSINFARYKGGKIGVLGASASAFDNAAVALESGAGEVHLFVRRSRLPQINKSKWTVFPGFFHGYRDLDDEARWRFYTYIFAEAVPPPHESVLRCDRHTGFAVHVAEPWVDVIPSADSVTIITGKARYRFDAVILATGFSVDLARRKELAHFYDKISLWADRVPQQEAERPRGGAVPYLGQVSADQAHTGRSSFIEHILLQRGLDHEPCGAGRRYSRACFRRQPSLLRDRQQPVHRQRRRCRLRCTPTTIASWSRRAISYRGNSHPSWNAFRGHGGCRAAAPRAETRLSARKPRRSAAR